MAGWYHQFNGHEFEQTLENRRGQKCLVCCSPWGHKESDMTQQLNSNPCSVTATKYAFARYADTSVFFLDRLFWSFVVVFFLISVLDISTCLYLNFNFTPEMARPRKIEELALIKKYLTGTQEKIGSWYVRKRKGVRSQDCNTSCNL